jgi:cytochrome c oxidase subunit 4
MDLFIPFVVFGDITAYGGQSAMEHSKSEHHIIPLAVYVKVFVALVCLTVVTVLAAQFDFGAGNAVIAFLIATIKASLVLAIFMHLKYDKMLNRVIVSTAFFFLVVMFFFCILDQVTRVIQKSTL